MLTSKLGKIYVGEILAKELSITANGYDDVISFIFADVIPR